MVAFAKPGTSRAVRKTNHRGHHGTYHISKRRNIATLSFVKDESGCLLNTRPNGEIGE